MFEKLSQAAERVASSVSRRQFLGRFGRSAMAAAAAVSGVVALTNDARAGRKPMYCDPDTSFTPCEGHLVGDSCKTSDGWGTCQEIVRGSGQCGCAERKRK